MQEHFVLPSFCVKACGVLPEQETTLSQVAPFSLYPLLHETAVQVPVDKHTLQVPLLTLIEEQGEQDDAPSDDQDIPKHFVQRVTIPPAEYSPAEQL